MNITPPIIALNCLVYFLVNYTGFGHNLLLGLNLYFIDALFIWQPLTSMFMHGNLTHLLMNMAVLFQFGSILERELGTLKFSLVYLLGGVATSLLSFVYIYFAYEFNGTFINLVGASGAISVLLGIMAFIDKSSAKGLLIAILLMSFVPMMMGVNVAWYAHIIGFGVGYLIMKARIL
ncbi:rhomboid family intramembrane serine protease [Campylobacter sp.]|uniref:rhomboid family intramembrane serine protease n=1 Tax=Campylobacter sp. TaxID=205 RepID=UPI002707A821|nr:rhomboid family intramembrane serine protease [Campylobacter sp.]